MKILRIKTRLKLLKPYGKNQAGLAKALGIPDSAITSMLKGERRIYDNEIPKIVEYLELDRVPIMGRVGAGGTIEPEFEQVPPEGLGQVHLPLAPPDDMIAFEVDGESMSPRYDPGDMIVVWKDQRKSVDGFYGHEAVVRTRDGRRYLKKITRGSRKDTVNLHNFNSSEPIMNVRLLWVGEVYVSVRAGQIIHRDSTPAAPRHHAA